MIRGAGAFAVCAVATVAVALTAPELSLAGSWLAFEVVAAALPVAAVLLVWRPVFGTLVVAAMRLARRRVELTRGGTPVRARARRVRDVAGAARRGGAAGARQRPLGRAGWALVGCGAVVTLGVLGIASAAVFDPHAQGARTALRIRCWCRAPPAPSRRSDAPASRSA